MWRTFRDGRCTQALALMLCSALPAAPVASQQAPAAEAAEAPAAAEPRRIQDVSLYSDIKARRVGDIVTVAIVERASASNSTRVSTSSNATFDNRGDAGSGLMGFLPEFGMQATSERSAQGSGQLSREGQLTARMAATVVEVRPNGDLLIQGQREIDVNEEKELLVVTGFVRASDIGPGNVVYSTNIADAKIRYEGKGMVTKGSRPNIIVRLLQWLF